MKIPENIFLSPGIYPKNIDLPKLQLHCVNMDEESYRASPFLDHRTVRPDNQEYCFDINELISLGFSLESQPTHYIFHNAFCCSTLFTRCLNTHDTAHVLREPDILLQVASIYRYANTKLIPKIDSKFVNELLQVISLLLSRRFKNNNSVVIKPTDGCNNIMGNLLSSHKNNKCLIIYSDVERFLTAIFKQPDRMQFARVRVNELGLDDARRVGKLRIDPSGLNAYQTAAYVWVLHMNNFRRVLNQFETNRVQLLNSEHFMEDQAQAVIDYLNFINLKVDNNLIRDRVLTATQSHSKEAHLQYDSEKREKDYTKQREIHSSDIDAGIQWIKETFGRELIDQFS